MASFVSFSVSCSVSFSFSHITIYNRYIICSTWYIRRGRRQMRIIRIRRSSREGNGPQPQSIRKGGEQQPQAINIGKGATTTSNKREGGHHNKEQAREGRVTTTSNKQGNGLSMYVCLYASLCVSPQSYVYPYVCMVDLSACLPTMVIIIIIMIKDNSTEQP